MTTIDLSERPARRPLARFLFGWTAVALLMGTLFKIQLPQVATWYAFTNQALEVYSFALLSLLVWRLAERLHRWDERLLMKVALHVLLGLAFLLIWQGAQMLYVRVIAGPNFWEIVYRRTWVFQLIQASLAYGTLIGVTLAIQSSRREREQERREGALQIAARESELAALKAQLHPHFLFNSLNSLLALIDTDAPRAREMVIRLSELLQSSLRRIDLPQVPLQREIELVRAYLEVEKIRFSSRLAFDIQVSSESAGVGVPPLILQPLVENAVKHGISHSIEGGEVRVNASVTGGRLYVEISNTGADGREENIDGIGLELTRRRLEGSYGDDYQFELNRSAGRSIVALNVPATPCLTRCA